MTASYTANIEYKVTQTVSLERPRLRKLRRLLGVERFLRETTPESDGIERRIELWTFPDWELKIIWWRRG